MKKVISLEEYRKEKSVSDDMYQSIYDYFSRCVNENISSVCELFEKVKSIKEFDLQFNKFVGEALACLYSQNTKEEILQAIKSGNIFQFESILSEVLLTNPMIHKIYFNLKN